MKLINYLNESTDYLIDQIDAWNFSSILALEINIIIDHLLLEEDLRFFKAVFTEAVHELKQVIELVFHPILFHFIILQLQIVFSAHIKFLSFHIVFLNLFIWYFQFHSSESFFFFWFFISYKLFESSFFNFFQQVVFADMESLFDIEEYIKEIVVFLEKIQHLLLIFTWWCYQYTIKKT